jgi:hypothetical protein
MSGFGESGGITPVTDEPDQGDDGTKLGENERSGVRRQTLGWIDTRVLGRVGNHQAF